MLLSSAIASAAAGLALPSAFPGGDPLRRRVATVTRTDVPPRIDGVLDEAVWSRAVPIGALTQVEPSEGAEPSERTDVFLLYDLDTLYVGVRCWDSEPDRIISTQRERDADLEPDDRVEIVFDTFLDRRNAYFFQMSPAGSKGDALISNNGGDFNKPWDGIWDGRSSVDAEGWSFEMAIPFKTLSFRDASSPWGFNLNRYIRRRNESARWASASRDTSLFLISSAGELRGFEGIHQGIGLDVAPFFVGTWQHESVTSDGDTDLLGDVGLDAFYRVTTNLTASLTLNTDFAETEVDERQINLTRFPLFFPERRDFFLENSGVFQFAGGDQSLLPFFSRRIGLVGGETIPIDVGLKATGRAGPWNVGVLDVQTGSTDGLDDANLFVTRLSRNVGEHAAVGGIVTIGDPTGQADNSVVGLDWNYRGVADDGKRWNASVYGLQSSTSGVSGNDDHAFGASLEYPNDVWRWEASAKEIQEDFDPRLGFVPRVGVRQYEGQLFWRPRADAPDVRRYSFGVTAEAVTDRDDGLETSRLAGQVFGIELESGDELAVELEHTQENLTAPFDITDTITIPAGDYDFGRVTMSVETAQQREFVLDAEVGFGGFFDGERRDYSIGLDWRPSALFTGGVEFEHNDIDLPGGSFDTQVARLLGNFAFTPDLAWRNFVQWDSESSAFGVNSRWRWLPEPGQELFLVFNQSLQGGDGGLHTEFQELALKVVYTLRF